MTDRPEPLDLDERLLQRYCAGSASLAEAEQIEAWFEQYPEQRAWYQRFRAELAQSDFSPLSAAEQAAAWRATLADALQRRPALRQGATNPSNQRIKRPALQRARPRLVSRWVGFGVAAAFILLAGWVATSYRVIPRVPVATETYTTASGERATISLADGSTVMLNVASRLEVPVDYTTGNHTVRLTGEALFTVTHHSGTPLTVLAGPTATRVLGTSFVVRRYPTDTTTVVAVRDGKVAVGSVVIPASRVAVVGARHVVRLQPGDDGQFGFASGVLTLQNMLLAQAIPELDRWYNADIRLGDPALAAKVVKGYVPAGSLADLTELLSVAFDVRVVRDGRVLTLYPR